MSSGHIIKDQNPFEMTKFPFSRENQILLTIVNICKAMVIATTIDVHKLVSDAQGHPHANRITVSGRNAAFVSILVND